MTGASPLVDLARAAVAGRRLIAVALAAPQLADLERFGGHVLADILVLPAGAPDPPPGPRPALVLRGPHADVFAHVVDGFAAALDAAHAPIADLLAAVDPHADAWIAAYLPVPRRAFPGRRLLAQDAAIALPLEDKADPALAAALPTPPTRPLRWPCAPSTWSEIQRSLGADALVVQALGRSGAGAGTRIVRAHADAARALPALGPGPLRAAPLLPGDPCNAMGLVPAEGPPIALPATRQLIAEDPDGRPVYVGNALEPADFSDDERRAIAQDVRALGRHLAARGFTGPFGVDFIRAPGGRRAYHDLNPRMNGVAGLLAAALADPAGASPLPVLLLAKPAYTADEAALLEAELARAAALTPRWRLLLSLPVRAPLLTPEPPPSGRLRVDLLPAAPHLRLTPAPRAPLDPDHADLQVTLAPGAALAPGDRLVLGELTGLPALGRRLLAALGPAAAEALARALLPALSP